MNMRGNARRDRDESPPAGLDLDLFPEIAPENRPRDIVFDTLRESERQVLVARGYRPLVLRTMPRRTLAEEHAYFVAFMQGALEQTIAFDKARSDALFYELKSRGHLDKRHFDSSAKPTEAAAQMTLMSALTWDPSRHNFTGNTTIVEPEKMMDLMQKLLATEQQERNAPVALRGGTNKRKR